MEDLDKKLFETVKSIVLNESVEQIDEISKKTLGSYIRKASGVYDHERSIGKHAASSIDAERYVNNPDNDPYYGKNTNKKIHDKLSSKLKNRRIGIDKALDKLTKEDIEQIDEISKKTLGSYIKKASGQVGSNNFTAGYHSAKDGTYGSRTDFTKEKDSLRRADKREKGIERATDRLTKEDIDHINENLEIYTYNDVMAILENVLEYIFTDDTE